MSLKQEKLQCNDCTRCPYDYCINEKKEMREIRDRTDYFKKYNAMNKEKINRAHRRTYEERKEKGICVRCSSKATHGLYCRDHYFYMKRKNAEKAQAQKRKRQERGRLNEYRKTHGLCLWCGEKATGNTCACDKHRKIFAAASQKSEGRQYWRKLEKARIAEVQNAEN